MADRSNNRIQRFFDSDAWFSGTNTFVDGGVGPTSVAVGSGDILGTSLTLDTSKGLVVGETTTVNAGGSLSVNGGTLTTPTLRLDGGTFAAPDLSGINTLQFTSGTLNLTGPSGLTVGAAGPLGALVRVGNSQSLIVDNTTTIASGGKITVAGPFSSDLLVVAENGQLDAPTGYTNSDEIQLRGPSARITGGTLTNSGLISGEGRIDAVVNNSPTGEFHNFGGQIDFIQKMTNESGGFIGGRDTFFRFGGGLINNGDIGLSAGVHDVIGTINNTATGRIMVAGQSTATFYGKMKNNGDIFTGQGSQSVFLGDVSGGGNFPGPGIVEFAGDVFPGNSPGTVSFGGDVVLGATATTLMELAGVTDGAQHDQLNIAGTVNLDGTLQLASLAPYNDPATRGTADDFTIITSGDRSGTFSTVQYDGSTLAPDVETDGNGSFRDHVAGGRFRSVTYTSTAVSVQNLLASAGDTDGDRDVDTVDLTGMIINYTGATGSTNRTSKFPGFFACVQLR